MLHYCMCFICYTKSNNTRDFNSVPVCFVYFTKSVCLTQIPSCISSTVRWSRTGSSFISLILMLALCLGKPLFPQSPYHPLILLLWLVGLSLLFLRCSTPIPFPIQTLCQVGVGRCPYLKTLDRSPHRLGCPGLLPPCLCYGRTCLE